MSAILRRAFRASLVLAPVAEAADAVVGRLPGAARRQRTSLRVTTHRPWPVPSGPWVMGQTWVDLLFAHWPVPAERVRRVVPDAVPLDLFGGSAWLSVTPFEVIGTRARGTPPPPGLSRFPELNVRTYVTFDGRPGIWFFSLDAASALAVRAARALYRLPYFRAAMRIERQDGSIDYVSDRTDPDGPPARFAARYRATGPAAPTVPGTLEAWLVERYRLYTLDGRGRLLCADIHHRPWSVRPVSADIRENTMGEQVGIDLRDPPALAQLARRQDVVFWPLGRAEAAAEPD